MGVLLFLLSTLACYSIASVYLDLLLRYFESLSRTRLFIVVAIFLSAIETLISQFHDIWKQNDPVVFAMLFIIFVICILFLELFVLSYIRKSKFLVTKRSKLFKINKYMIEDERKQMLQDRFSIRTKLEEVK